MRYAFTVLRYTLLRNARDISSTMEMVLIPLALIVMFGVVLGDQFESRDIGATPIAYVVEADGPSGDELRDFLNSERMGRYLRVTESATREEAHRLLEGEEVVTAIILEAGPAITLLESPGGSLRTEIVRSALDTFTRGANLSRALAREGRTGVVYETVSAEFEDSTISRDGRVPGAFDFYAVAMLVLFVMYIAQYASAGLREDMFEPVGDRIRATPIAGWEHISGKLAAHLVSGLVQGAVIITVTRLALDVNWGTRPLLLAGIVASLCTFAVAFGGLVLAVVRDIQKADGIISVLILASMLFSGGVFPTSHGSSWFHTIQLLLPHYHGQRALLAMIYGIDPGAIGAAFLYFLGGAIALFAATVVLTRRSV